MDNIFKMPEKAMTEQEKAMQYFRRHAGPPFNVQLCPGLVLVRDNDGLWLDFSTTSGLTARVHMDMIGPQGHKDSIIQKAIDQWCRETGAGVTAQINSLSENHE